MNNSATYPEYGIKVTLDKIKHSKGNYRVMQHDIDSGEKIEIAFFTDYSKALKHYESICTALF